MKFEVVITYPFVCGLYLERGSFLCCQPFQRSWRGWGKWSWWTCRCSRHPSKRRISWSVHPACMGSCSWIGIRWGRLWSQARIASCPLGQCWKETEAIGSCLFNKQLVRERVGTVSMSAFVSWVWVVWLNISSHWWCQLAWLFLLNKGGGFALWLIPHICLTHNESEGLPKQNMLNFHKNNWAYLLTFLFVRKCLSWERLSLTCLYLLMLKLVASIFKII